MQILEIPKYPSTYGAHENGYKANQTNIFQVQVHKNNSKTIHLGAPLI